MIDHHRVDSEPPPPPAEAPICLYQTNLISTANKIYMRSTVEILIARLSLLRFVRCLDTRFPKLFACYCRLSSQRDADFRLAAPLSQPIYARCVTSSALNYFIVRHLFRAAAD